MSSVKIQNLIRQPRLWLGLGLALLLVTGGVWCYKTSNDPERVFWGMVEQSLTTRGVTVEVDQDRGGTSAHQIVKYSFGSPNASHSLTKLSQPGTNVTNEAVGTPTADYTRYISIKTDQKTASGKAMDFSKVVGVWAKSQSGSPAQLFSQAALGTGLPLGGLAVPMGNVASEPRNEFLQKLREDNLYKISFDKVKKSRKNGRLQYAYAVTMKPVAYANMMKRFDKTLGLNSLTNLDPASFTGQPAFEITLTVDVRSRHLVQAETSNGVVRQQYESYDVPVTIEIPAKAIPISELQERLTKLQQ